MTDLERIEDILERLPGSRVTVIGDFFLDQYWSVGEDLAETSLETGLRSNQVTAVRVSPGAAGTVVNNLCALGVGEIRAVGFSGEDGPGFELRRALEAMKVDTRGLLSMAERMTPVYTKPMFRRPGEAAVEGERFDIKNRTPTSRALEESLCAALDLAVEGGGAVIALDQVQEDGCGVLTDSVRAHLGRLGEARGDLLILADSRCRIARFRNVMLKPNIGEARVVFPRARGASELLQEFFRLTGRPVFLTEGSEGITVYDGTRSRRISAIPVRGPVDPVGAGDSVSAALASALSVGADPFEAAQLAVLAASVTVRKIGTTGTASPAEIVAVARGLGRAEEQSQPPACYD